MSGAEMTREPESAARRARSAVSAAVSARLTTPGGEVDLLGGHVVLPDGRFVVFVSPSGAVASCLAANGASAAGSSAVGSATDVGPAARPVPGRIVLVDLAPVAVNVRERARVEVVGTLDPAADDDARHAWWVLTGESGGPTDALALELAPEVVLLTEGPRTVRVDLDTFMGASPDPVAPYEAALLQHLASSHQSSVALLARSVGAGDLGATDGTTGVAWTTAVPLRITTDGLTLRFCGPGGFRDVELPFPEPVADPELADRAVAELVHACQVRATFS